MWSAGGHVAEDGTWRSRGQICGPVPDPTKTSRKTQSETQLRTTFPVSASPQSYDLILLYFAMTEIVKKIKENVAKWAKQVALILSLALPFSFWDGLWQVFLSFFSHRLLICSLFFLPEGTVGQWQSLQNVSPVPSMTAHCIEQKLWGTTIILFLFYYSLHSL